jgi:hypothetical protein
MESRRKLGMAHDIVVRGGQLGATSFPLKKHERDTKDG